MSTVADVAGWLEEFAPPRLAEEWDNVGLLVGDRRRRVRRLMTCLTVTPQSAAEAVAAKADLIVTHHPMPFRALKRITGDTPQGRMLLDLIGARVAVFSPHTAFDSAREGINQQLAAGLGLRVIEPLIAEPDSPEPGLGAGRMGTLRKPTALATVARRAKRFLNLRRLQVVGDPEREHRCVAVACGSGGEFLTAARRAGCDCLVTGETRFHTCLEAEARNMGLVLVGHFGSERFAVERLAEFLAGRFPELEVWASREETDPLQWC